MIDTFIVSTVFTHISSKKRVIYAKENSVLMAMIENIIESEITVIILENIEVLLIIFVI